jgi:DNA-binding XRE family transcriptional regulator
MERITQRRTSLASARQQARLSQAALAKLLGVSKATIWAIETGRRDPSFRIMQRWTEAVPATSFLSFDNRLQGRPF